MDGMRKSVFLFFSLLLSFTLSAQQSRTVSGKLIDSTGLPVAKAGITLFYETPGDTVRTISSLEGNFRFDGVKSRPFFIRTSHLGYFTYEKKVEDTSLSINHPSIILKQQIRTLEEIIIETPPIQVKEDTVEYKADSFKVKPNAMVEDLLKKLPGVSVDKDGNVTAQGKSVTRVKVNGKDFFLGDVKTATRELSADMIDKVQVVDDYGDQSALSGIRDGEPEKVINLQLKKDKNKGIFGRATAGYGTNDRYTSSINANYFNNNKQLSVFGNSNNVNNSLFNIGGNTGAQQGFSLGGNGGGQAQSGTNGAAAMVMQAAGSNNSGSAGDGISTTHSIGTNFRNDFTGSHKGSVYGSYSFTRRMTDGQKNISRQNIFENSSFTNNQDYTFYNQSNNHRFNLNFEYTIDSFNYIKIIPQISYSESNNQSNAPFNNINEKGITTVEGNNRDSSLSDRPNLSLNALYNHRFHKRGRNFSVNMNLSSSSNESDKYTENLTNNLSLPLPVEIRRNQLANQDNVNRGLNLRFNYSEPLAKDRFLDLIYSYRKSYAKNDKKTYDLGTGAPLFNPFLSNAYENDFDEQRIGANVRTVKKKYNYTLGVSVQPVNLNGYSITKDSAYTPQQRINVFPVARFGYNFTRTKSFNANYSGNANQPSFSQLQPVRDNSNVQFQSQGNPGLKPEQAHNLSMFYNNFNFQSGKVLFTGINARVMQNQIVNNVISLTSDGAQLTIPENVNGYYTVSGFYNWSKPYQNRKYVFSLNGLVNYTHNIGLIDSQRNIGKNVYAAQGVNMEYNHKEWWEIDFGARYFINKTEYSITEVQNNNSNGWTLTSNSRLDMPGALTLRYDLQYMINNGLNIQGNTNYLLMNASLEKTVFKKKNGFIRLSGYDLFKQNTNISRVVTGNSITDTRTKLLTRYFMLSFTYRLNRFQGQQSGNRPPGDGPRQMRITNQ